MKSSQLLEVLGEIRKKFKKNASQIDILNPAEPKIKNLDFSLNSCKVVKVQETSDFLIEKWNQAIKKNSFDDLTNRDLRSLLWQKEIAFDDVLFKEMFRRGVVFRSSSIGALIFSLSERWNDVLSDKLSIKKIAKNICALSQENRLANVKKFMLNKNGHVFFSEYVCEQQKDFSEVFCEIFGVILPQNAYLNHAVRYMAFECVKIALSDTEHQRKWFYKSVLNQLSKSELFQSLDLIVEEIKSTNLKEPKEELKSFILSHPNLGDPRLPAFESNWDRKSKVTQAVIEWLSQSDIEFFFKLFFENKGDSQGRKIFWLKYAHLIRGTRVVMSPYDKDRLSKKISDLAKENKISTGLLGEFIKGQTDKATAFMMDFGKIQIVELSKDGHACYLYGKESKFKFKDRYVFWGTKSFDLYDLKNTDICDERISHREGWESKLNNILAQNGVRLTSKH